MRIYPPRSAPPLVLAAWRVHYQAQAIWIDLEATANILSLSQRRLNLRERGSVHSIAFSAHHQLLNRCIMVCVQQVPTMANRLRILKMMTNLFRWRLSKCSTSGQMEHHILENSRQWIKRIFPRANHWLLARFPLISEDL